LVLLDAHLLRPGPNEPSTRPGRWAGAAAAGQPDGGHHHPVPRNPAVRSRARPAAVLAHAGDLPGDAGTRLRGIPALLGAHRGRAVSAIELVDVSKRFILRPDRRPALQDTLMHWLRNPRRIGRSDAYDFWALRQINLAIDSGET